MVMMIEPAAATAARWRRGREPREQTDGNWRRLNVFGNLGLGRSR